MSSSHNAITLHRRPWRLLAGLLLAIAGLLSTVQSYAACSSDYLDQVYLNEYYFGTDLNFLEVYIPNNNKVAAGVTDNWSIRVYDGVDSYTDYSLDSSNAYTNICTFGSKTFITHDVPGGLPGTGRTINAVLLDGNGDEIDYLKFSQQSPITEYVSPECSYGPTHDIDLEIPNYGNKDVARFPDGRGEWSISSLTGANTSYSQCTSNDAGITKSVSDAAIVVNTLASFTLQVSNPGKQAVEAVSVTESWPAALSYDSHITTAGSYDHNSGVWTIGTLDKDTTASLTINFFGDTPGSYTNVATLTYTDNKTTYTVDDYAIAEIVPAPVTGPHHLRLLHTGSGLTCTPAAVTLQACADADCTTLYGDTVTVTLSPTGWVGGDTVSFSGGQVELALRHTTAESVTLGIDSAAPAPMNPTQCYLSGVAGNCDMVFHDSGFAFDVPTVSACDASAPVTISAVRKDNLTEQCVPAFSNRVETINFWSDYSDPASGSRAVTLNGTAIASAAPGNGIPLSFDVNGQSSFTLSYPDAGLMQLNAVFSGNGEEAGLLMSGSDAFVAVPAKFYLYSGDANADCASSDAGCSVFRRAGEPFNLSIRAACADNSVTPNFIHSGFTLEHTLVAPAGGVPGTLALAAFDFSAADNGEVSLADQALSEVGVFTFTAASTNPYFGETLTNGSSANIGRFIPADFAIDHTHHAQCNGFTYAGLGPTGRPGEPFSVGGTVTARNVYGDTTLNYAGDFAKLLPADITASARDGAAAASGTLSFAVDSLNFSNGIGVLQENDASYRFAAIGGPQSLHLALNAEDSDTVSGAEEDAAKTVEYRFGRLELHNAHGPQTNDLKLPVVTEYHDGSGFVENLDDSCSLLPLPAATSLDGWSGNLQAGETSVIATSAMLGSGTGHLTLSAPGLGGDGNDGSVDVTLDMSGLAWLRPDGNDDGNYTDTSADDPAASATFGVYRGDDRFYFWRETP